MIIKVKSLGYFGIESFLTEVEVDISNGLPTFNIVGLGDTAINESKERIKAGIRNSGYKLDPKRIIVNLTPANIKKVGTHFDLPITVVIICGQKAFDYKKEILENYLFMGEISLSGDLKRTQGIVNGAILAKELGYKGIVIPFDNLKEGSLIKGIDVIVVKNLKDIEIFLTTGEFQKIENSTNIDKKLEDIYNEDLDFSHVKGQEKAKRALEICAAGGHNFLMVGTPGCGKTMLAKRIMSILPPLTEDEKIELTKLYSIAGKLTEENPIITKRPFRSPHHTSSGVAIIGGGRTPALGEITLANKGVLFLDEIVEFKKDILENLREPLEEKKISITRAGYRVEFPSDFILLASCNPCKCGMYFEPNGLCTCTPNEVSNYMKKLSGPILDRIDLKIEMTRLSEDELLDNSLKETSEEIRKRVINARNLQKKRFNSDKLNSHMTRNDIEKFIVLDENLKILLKTAIKNLNLSARAYDRILKVARTIADLSNSKNIEREHLFEAISYRITER
ncbi:YifB family Mg chelatase-like AAA ATPase [Fusobacterium sp. FSA-380-WT-3A]|uniref:YifB family Mg chelatase-like AAA ATPase n=1 Tax=Fusobacterium sp. FSA-380-WT-3A TaxID=2725304 RepID=UPI00147784C7|nr:YifB family Mg chelatase-like AAA ATPase [Fusobacterium sp. FSA-380-WT-3A]NME35682.1 YifB family Mg chelatase-like AAA ATPase [Fusobacterium sp. FSA-380-WT-3A]